MDILNECTLCPRECKANRYQNSGFCGANQNPKIARASLHFWEEPCISGQKGSGTIFFSGCNLRCIYCQNHQISIGQFGKEITTERLSEIFLELQTLGAHNINLVTPTPYIPQIKIAIDLVRDKIHIPFVANMGGYEKAETIRTLRGYVDIFLTDVKYKSPILSEKYSNASDYFEHSINSLEEMLKIAPKPIFDEYGILTSGVIVRHLVLPNCRHDSIEILKELKKRFGTEQFLLSLMSQYTPTKNLTEFSEFNRRITSFEYDSVVNEALRLGFTNAYVQEKSSAKEEYTPPFDLSGV